MTNETEKQTRELTSADLEHVVGGAIGGTVTVRDSIVTGNDARASTGGFGGGAGAGKVQMQDFHF